MTNEGHVPAQDPVAGEREGFSRRLRMLREAADKSQRELAEVLRMDHSTVSVYEKPDGSRVPDLEYIDGLLAEVRSRTAVTEDVLKDTRDSYGRLLRLLCDQSQGRGRTHGYRQMLRVYELTLEIESLTAELDDVRQQQRDVAAELARLQETAGAAADSERLRLEENAETWEQHRAWLARRREALVSDLDAHSAQLRQFPPSDTSPASDPVGVPPQQPPGTRTRSRPIMITAAFLCGTLVSALAFYAPNHYPFAGESGVYQLGSDCRKLPLLCLYTKDSYGGGGIALEPGGTINSLGKYGLNDQISSWSNAVSGVTCYWYPDENLSPNSKGHPMKGTGVNLKLHGAEDNSMSSVKCDSKK